jgi:hypothetical protein
MVGDFAKLRAEHVERITRTCSIISSSFEIAFVLLLWDREPGPKSEGVPLEQALI